jgi:hypothetical protein
VVLKANIQALSLLERIIIDSEMTTCLEDMGAELEAKAASIVKDIAKRIMDLEAQELREGFDNSSSSTDSNHESVVSKLQ